MNCRICGSTIAAKEKFPIKITPEKLFSAFIVQEVEKRDFYYCSKCKHGQIESIFDEAYFDSYSLREVVDVEKDEEDLFKNSVSSKKLGGGTGGRYDMILRRIKEIRPTANKFLDIGCGVGDLLLDAKKFFSYVEGIEPSKAQCEIGRKRGLNVKNGYFDSTFCGREYDVVVSTQVLGYIDDLTSHIKLLKSVCADYGVGYIEVPNGMKIVRGKIF